jgi:hypothetical protein
VSLVAHFVSAGGMDMPTVNPRVNLVIGPKLYNIISDMARNEGLSLSSMARELIMEAMELREDAALSHLAEIREKSFLPHKALSHDQTWG